MSETHYHSDIEFNFLMDGTITYLIQGERISLPARRLAIFWAAIPHRLVETKCRSMFWLTLPLAWFLQWKLPQGFTNALLHGALLIEPRPLSLDAPLIEGWSDFLSPRKSDPEPQRIALLEIEARLRRMARDFHPPPGPRRKMRRPSTAENPSKVEAMAALIAQRYTETLTVPQIAAAAGLNANYASTVFKQAFGMGLMDYVVEHRVWHAQRLLATTDAKVLDVALDSGFGSLSRFYEAFQRSCKVSPRQYRLQFRFGAKGPATHEG